MVRERARGADSLGGMRKRGGTVLVLVAIGVLAGVLSGLFGVGGGVIVVPALMAFAQMDQRRASATSLVAIAPAAVVGAVTYAVQGEVHWLAALTLAVGSVIGAPIGARLLRALPLRALPWIFVGFIAVVLVSLFTTVPTRGGEVHFGVVEAIVLLLLGLLSGVLSGLVGVGGGVVIVPGLEVVLGAGDLLAKGTSLLTMVPTSVSGTVANLRRRAVDLRVGLTVGITAAVCSPGGAVLARLVDPQVGTWLFAAFLVVVAVIVLSRGRRRAPQNDASDGEVA
ncbi:sulfite exporter TauE/SafE family protein [Curtobacterium sp. MCLR17_042]|uniref:sulfite exporter TauE/SafE family protein n=2 Tax=Microbacteriaceae TaxID=85023 RepID=UPI000DA95632|nr:sulfite exporter TauE/SafE family protein [Curtobacterium sp. MCLR17_042]PZE23421.1 sulfite exporter TauE/SafE family protein [Curtobacterium sp. MCLR17_042]